MGQGRPCSFVLLRYLALSCATALGCGDDDHGAGPGDAGPSAIEDASFAVPDPLLQATATATLAPLGTSGSAATPVSGSATFVATTSGVDLTVAMRGCADAAAKPVRILEQQSCADVSPASPSWAGQRGAGIPGVLCTSGTSGEGFVRYSRSAEVAQHWTVGDGSPHDVVGHAVALFDPTTHAPTACGVIERSADRALVATPPETEAPSVEVRAVLSGICLSRLMPGAAAGGCLDEAGMAACASEHCELGACLQTCAGFAACLDAADDPCAASFSCEVSAECAACQSAVTSCVYGFCSAQLNCPSIPRPGGPCSHLVACCTLQGERAAGCLDIASLSASLGGEATCLNGLTDWDVISHLHVPCDTKAAADDAIAQAGGGGAESLPKDAAPCATQADCDDGVCFGAARTATISSLGRCLPREPTPRLADGVVGSACRADDACGGGECASHTPLLTPYPDGYCSGRCYDDASCGAGGSCVMPRGSSEPGHCFESCETDTDCARDGYRCTSLGDGERVMQACYPRAAALPDHVVGRACESDAECGDGAATCVAGLPLSFLTNEVVPAPGGYCSAPCLYDADCGAGAQCISGGWSGGQCMASCDDATPCRDGYLCFDPMRDLGETRSVCAPIWDEPSATAPDAGP